MRGWIENLADRVDELQTRGLIPSLDELAASDVFTDAVVNATRAAQATHQQEKLDALRNGVLNSLGPDAPTVDEQARFFRLVEQMTPSHLRLLAFLHDQGAAFDRAGIARPDPMPPLLWMAIEAGLPEFNANRTWYDLLLFDTSIAGLTIRDDAGTQLTTSEVFVSYTTDLGKRFLAFISPTPS
jgi:hypothetical protein